MRSLSKIVKESYWIIVNYKKNSIWKKVFLSYEEAKSELDTQILKNGNKPDWHIEQREWSREVDEAETGEFANF